MSKYEVTLKFEVEINHDLDNLEALEETLYEELRIIVETAGLVPICKVEEVWDMFEKPEQTIIRGY